MHFYLGIDVSKAKLDCALRLSNGKYRNKVIDNNPVGFKDLQTWLHKHKVQPVNAIHVCMEATNIYWEAIALHLANLGMKVSVVNPAQIKAFGASRLVRTKTDKVDAQLIAEFAAERDPKAWEAPSKSEQQLRALVLRRDALQAMRTQESNRLGVAQETVRRGIEEHLLWLEEEIKAINKKIRDHINKDPDLKAKKDLLEGIPGIGKSSSASLLSFYADTKRFDNARKAVAFAGLDPRQHESGSSVRGKAKLSKVGHSFIRKAMYMPAVVALYKTAWGIAFYERLKTSGKCNMVIIGAMMRKLIHVVFGVLKSGMPFDVSKHMKVSEKALA